MINDDLLADLPAPSDDEPPSLRGDIADELADHLHCALRRELVKDGNAPAAEARVLHRFGDPQKIARRLWWQAMWSHIMRQRMVTGLQWLMTSAAVILAGAVFWQQLTLLNEIRASRKAESDNYQILSEAINEIRANRLAGPIAKAEVPERIQPDKAAVKEDIRPTPTRGESFVTPKAEEEKPAAAQSLTVRLVQATANGPPVSDAIIGLFTEDGRLREGRGRGGRTDRMRKLTDQSGTYHLEVVDPDRYEVRIQLADGQTSRQSIIVRAKENRELTVICPVPREKVVFQVTAPPLPKSLQERGCILQLSLEMIPQTINEVDWTLSRLDSRSLEFPSQGGIPTKIYAQTSNQWTNLDGSKPEDGALVMHSGPIKCGCRIAVRIDSGTLINYDYVESTSAIKPGEEHWQLEFPEGYVAKVEKKLVQTVMPTGLTDQPAEQSLGDKSRLIVKINTETKDGTVPADASFRLTDEKHVDRDYSFDQEGRCDVGVLESGRYKLRVNIKNLFTESQFIVLRSGQERVEQVICPPSGEKTTVTVTAPPVPEDFRKNGLHLSGKLSLRPIKLEGRTWLASQGNSNLTFSPVTGQLVTIGNSDVSGDAPEDRVLFVPTGTYILSPAMYLNPPRAFEWPLEKFTSDPPIFEAKPGENKWELKVPEQFWTEAREKQVIPPGTALPLY